MTETTDIKALRDKHALALKDLTERLTECNRLNYYWDELSAFAAFSSTVIDQLEAERRNVGVLEGVIARKEFDAQQVELAARRGTQEPVLNPVLAYADSYRAMARQGSDSVPIWGVITDLERNIAPLFTHPDKPVVVPPDGWKLVPIEPTERMIINGFESDALHALSSAVLREKGWPYSCRESAELVRDIFKTMLRAAPKPDSESGIVVKDGE